MCVVKLTVHSIDIKCAAGGDIISCSLARYLWCPDSGCIASTLEPYGVCCMFEVES